MGLVAWMLIVMIMGAGIGRTSHTLELRGACQIIVVCIWDSIGLYRTIYDYIGLYRKIYDNIRYYATIQDNVK